MKRIAVVGAGPMGRVHALALTTIPGAVVAAVVDKDMAVGADLAAEIGAPCRASLAEALARDAVEVVDCCVPTPYHRAIVEEAAAAGRQVICEKPLALTVEDGAAMIAACEAAGVRLLVAQVVRFFPQYRAMARAVRAGEIGAVARVTLLRQSFVPRGGTSWYTDESKSGGILLDLMVHDFDWALLQCGPAARVFAKVVRREQPSFFLQGMATVTHRSGAISQVTGTWGFPGPFTTAAELVGTQGVLSYHSDDVHPVRVLAATGAAGHGDVALPESLGEDPYRTELAHFVEVLEGRAQSLVQPHEALAAVALANAARRSAASGQAVRIKEGSQ
jgi:predicted dehydrogenase